MFDDCARDESCHFRYWHIQKTGGSSIEYTFSYNFMHGTIMDSCCLKNMLERFSADVDTYCRAKFTSYEVKGDQTRQIVETCMEYLLISRSIVLATYREPISRFISMVNQLCNKDAQRFVKVCGQCASVAGSESIFYWWIDFSNKVYLSIADIAEMDMPNVQVLLLDLMYLNFLFQKLSNKLPDFYIKSGSINTEVKTLCSFGATSAIAEELAISANVYHNISMGRQATRV